MKIFAIYLTLCSSWLAITSAHPINAVDGPRHDVQTRAAGDRGSYTVSGLGTRKQAVLNAGGNTLDLAIAMLETEDMNTDYPYGGFAFFTFDNMHRQMLIYRTLPGDNKSGDSANFGIFKQNWGMLRVCASRAGFVGQSASQYNNGAKLKCVFRKRGQKMEKRPSTNTTYASAPISTPMLPLVGIARIITARPSGSQVTEMAPLACLILTQTISTVSSNDPGH